MSLEDSWRSVVTAISRSNNVRITSTVNAERDRVAKSAISRQFDADVMKRVGEQHFTEEIAKLRDYVAYLIWAKLAQSSKCGPANRSLGRSNLRDFLLARDPQTYATEDVESFAEFRSSSRSLGDLRAFLCARRDAKTQLYTHEQLDRDLCQWEIEELRRRPPESVTAGLGGRDHERALNDFRRAPATKVYHALLEGGWCGMPQRIIQWAYIITHQLVTGTCDCPEAFSLLTEENPKAYSEAEKRCRNAHFLSHKNLEDAAACRQPQQKQAITDPLKYVERAVIERLHEPTRKTFANTMLCNLYVTPSGYKLRKMKDPAGRKASEHLTEAGREWARLQQHTTESHRRERTNVVLPCFVCPSCRSFVGESSIYHSCVEDRHFWCYATVGQFEDPEPRRSEVNGEFVTLSINVCPANHFWSSKIDGQCPACSLPPAIVRKKATVYYPSNVDFAGVGWRPTLPVPPHRRAPDESEEEHDDRH